MAIYRSDQAQFTFGVEGTAGAAPERNMATTLYTATALDGAVLKGDRTIVVDAVTNIDTGIKSMILIGNTSGEATGQTPEIRRVVKVESTTVTLESPLSFDHPDNGVVAAINFSSSNNPDGNLNAMSAGASNSTSSSYITWIPGIYDTVDVPDPVEAFEPRYMLGQNTVRNPYQIVKGQQTLTGSVAGITLVNGWPLRFPLGNVQSIIQGSTAAKNVMANMAITIKKGEVWAELAASGGASTAGQHSDNVWVILGNSTSPTSSTKCEIRKIIDGHSSSVSSGASTYVRLNQPVNFDHTAEVLHFATNTVMTAETAKFHHHIFDSVELPSITWNINMKDENGTNTFQRRYTGGKVGSMTLTAEEGGLLTCDWDTATFMNFNHNQQRSVRRGTLASGDLLRRYLPMQDIAKTDVGVPEIANSLPITQPYYFSEGTVKFFGNSVARVRTFSITIANGEEPRYYIRDTGDDSRTPFEIKEGNREYSMTATIALPDAAGAGGTLSSSAAEVAHNVWRELIMGGDGKDDNSVAGGGLSGFDIELKFTRDSGTAGGGWADEITIRVPGDYDGSTPNAKAGGLNQGALINSATINIDGSNPMEQAVDIVFRDLKIEIKDAEPLYP